MQITTMHEPFLIYVYCLCVPISIDVMLFLSFGLTQQRQHYFTQLLGSALLDLREYKNINKLCYRYSFLTINQWVTEPLWFHREYTQGSPQ